WGVDTINPREKLRGPSRASAVRRRNVKITISDLQRQIQRGPALVIGPGMTSSRGRESELLGKLREVYPDVEGGDLCGSYLDYADAVIAAAAASEGKIRTEIEAFFDNQLARNPTLSVMIKANWTAVIASCSDDHLRQELRDFIY